MSATPQELDLKILQKLLIKREPAAYKGDFGHVLVIGGDYGMAGAVRMAGEAALRVGAGLVSVATRPEHIDIICATRPELMCHRINHSQDLLPLIDKATVLVLGPGLGQSTWSQELFHRCIISDKPKVIDADGLNLLSKQKQQRSDWILTPHVGEAARLLKITTTDIQTDRAAAVHNLQEIYGGTIVLKGAGTLIANQTEVSICKYGNPGMASGGMGDVLSGVIGGLLAQGLNFVDAAKLAAAIHATAGDLAAAEGERGLLAMDLMPFIRQLANPS